MSDTVWLTVLVAGLTLAAVGSGVWLGWRLSSRRSGIRLHKAFLSATFFEQICDAAFVVENGVVVAANEASADMLGYEREELLGRPMRALLAEPEKYDSYMGALADGSIVDYEIRLRTAEGEVRDCLVNANARLGAEGRVISVCNLARNVTERRWMPAEPQRDSRGIFENASDAILVLDPDTEIVIDANRQAGLLYDFRPEQLIGRSMLDLSVDPERASKLWERVRSGSSFAAFESKQLRRDGRIIAVEVSAAETMYRGRPVILTINRDVTARREAENVLRESEQRFRLLLDSVIDYAIIMLDLDGLIISWNEAAERIMGYAPGDVLMRPASILLPPEERETLADRLAAASEGSSTARQVTRVRKDGRRFAASVVLTKIVDDNGAPHGYAEIIHDITARTELERAPQEVVNILRQVADEWTTTFDAVQSPILLLDASGEVRRLNRAAQILAGRPFDQLVHKRVSGLPGEPWRTIAVAAEKALAGNTASFRAADGESVWQVSTSVAGTEDETRVIAVAYDITLVTQLEASVRQNQVAAALGSLVAGVAHEVRNPLFTISATLDAWEARYGRTEGIERYAMTLRDQVDRLNRLMRDLLEYGKPNPLVFANGSLSEVIRAALNYCRPLTAQHQVEIVEHLVELPDVALDADRMEQVFLNVIDNAIRHSPPGGSVRIESALEGGQIVCRVLDEGPGLEQQDPEALFAPLYTRRRGGTGLGLPIARNIVQAHSGTITLVERTDRSGAMATIRLPLKSRHLPEARSGAKEWASALVPVSVVVPDASEAQPAEKVNDPNGRERGDV